MSDPSEKQIAYGNYAKGHKHVLGMRVSVENEAGSTRKGKDKDGAEWEQKLQHDYGYIRGTTGRDKDHVDVFLGPDPHNSSLPVHVIDQVDHHSGDFDEHKVVLGAKDADEAAQVYHANYAPGWRGLGEVTPTDLGTFKKWAFDGARKTKPFSELAQHQQERVGCKAGGLVLRKGYDEGGEIRPDLSSDQLSWLQGHQFQQGPQQVRMLSADDLSPGADASGATWHQGFTGGWQGGEANYGDAPVLTGYARDVIPGHSAVGDWQDTYSPEGQFQRRGQLAPDSTKADFWTGALMMAGPFAAAIGATGAAAGAASSAASSSAAPEASSFVFNPAVDSQAANAAIDAGGGNALSGYAAAGAGGVTANPVAASATSLLNNPLVRKAGSTLLQQVMNGGQPSTQSSSTPRRPSLGGLGYTNWGGGTRRYSLRNGGRVGYGGGGHVASPDAPGFLESLPHVLDGPAAALRGLVAGTAGLPGDVEGLARSVIPGVDNTPVLPTSDFYKEWLPESGKQADKTYGELGSLAGMDPFVALRAGKTVARGALQAAKALGTEALRPLDKAMQGEGALSQLLAPAAASRAYAVKPKGGNWAPGLNKDVYLDNLGRDTMPGPVLDWKNKKLDPYFKTYLGTAEDPLLQLEKEGKLHLDPESLRQEGYAIDDRGTWEDLTSPKARRSGVVDGEHGQEGFFPSTAKDAKLEGWQFHKEATGRPYKTPWEAMADGTINPARTSDKAAQWLDQGGGMHGYEAAREGDEAVQLPAWWQKQVDHNPDHRMYDFWPHNTDNGSNLGFDHVLDYLDQAWRAGLHKAELLHNPPELGMHPLHPDEARSLRALVDRGLDIHPDSLSKVSVPDAVRNTSEWNKLLASAKDAGELNKGIKQVHKTYDTGHQWVELAPEGLDAEGKAMRHCVGGYCSSVEDGSTRILSLRDKAGKPAVTVEVAPWDPKQSRNASYMEFLRNDREGQFGAPGEFGAWLKSKVEANPKFQREEAFKVANQFLAERELPPLHEVNRPPEIRQIKGPANRAPSPEVLAHVQDLVRGGVPGMEKWGQVGDLQNTGLLKLGDRYVQEPELKAAIKKHGTVNGVGWDEALARHLEHGVPEPEALDNFLSAFKEYPAERGFRPDIPNWGEIKLPPDYKFGE